MMGRSSLSRWFVRFGGLDESVGVAEHEKRSDRLDRALPQARRQGPQSTICQVEGLPGERAVFDQFVQSQQHAAPVRRFRQIADPYGLEQRALCAQRPLLPPRDGADPWGVRKRHTVEEDGVRVSPLLLHKNTHFQFFVLVGPVPLIERRLGIRKARELGEDGTDRPSELIELRIIHPTGVLLEQYEELLSDGPRVLLLVHLGGPRGLQAQGISEFSVGLSEREHGAHSAYALALRRWEDLGGCEQPVSVLILLARPHSGLGRQPAKCFQCIHELRRVRVPLLPEHGCFESLLLTSERAADGLDGPFYGRVVEPSLLEPLQATRLVQVCVDATKALDGAIPRLWVGPVCRCVEDRKEDV